MVEVVYSETEGRDGPFIWARRDFGFGWWEVVRWDCSVLVRVWIWIWEGIEVGNRYGRCGGCGRVGAGRIRGVVVAEFVGP